MPRSDKRVGRVGNIVANAAAHIEGFDGCPVVFVGIFMGYPWCKSLDVERFRWDPYGKGINEAFVWAPEDVEWVE